MAKRFTDTDKWKKPFYRRLSLKHKCLFQFIVDNCNMAGVWDVDLELASFQIGEKYNFGELKAVFEEKFFFFDHDQKLFIIDFIKFQYGDELTGKSPVHRKVIATLKGYKVGNDTLFDIVVNTLFDRVKEKDKEEEKEEEEEDSEHSEEKPPEKKKKKSVSILFVESPYYDLELFKMQFSGTAYEYCDLEIYYEKIKNWSASGGNKKIDWIATARNFMLADKEKGKLILKDGTKQVSQSEQSAGNAVDEYLKQQYASK